MDWWDEERLRAIAARAESSAASVSPAGVGSVQIVESALRRGADATACAEWMRGMGVTRLRYVGPFGDTGLSIGDSVVVKAGARVYSRRPAVPREGKLTIRSKTVLVANLSPGLVERVEGRVLVRNPLVTWAGKGGYWCWCDANNVELDASTASQHAEGGAGVRQGA